MSEETNEKSLGILGLTQQSVTAHATCLSPVLFFFMVHLKELLTRGILPYTNAAATHALSCQAMPCQASSRSHPSAHLYTLHMLQLAPVHPTLNRNHTEKLMLQ